jgi:hypothetical protein
VMPAVAVAGPRRRGTTAAKAPGIGRRWLMSRA